MARAVHRLNLILLPPGIEDRPPTAPLLEAARAADPDLPAPRADQGPVRFYAPGAFRVACPDRPDLNVTAAFVPALTRWRALQGAGQDRPGDRALDCLCGARHPLEALSYAPPCAFAATAVVLPDRDPDPGPAVEAAARAAWGGLRTLLQRG